MLHISQTAGAFWPLAYFVALGSTLAPAARAQDGAVWTKAAEGLSGSISCIAEVESGPATGLYAGGTFTIQGVGSAGGLARWDGTQWRRVAANPLGFGVVSVMLVVDEDGGGPAAPVLYIGGDFDDVDGAEMNNVVRWDGERFQPLGDGVGGPVRALAWFDDGNGPSLFVGGTFEKAGAVAAANIARWDGDAWHALGLGLDGSVASLCPHDEDGGGAAPAALFAGGYFVAKEDPAAQGIARWDGEAWSAVGAIGADAQGIVALLSGSVGGRSGLFAAGPSAFRSVVKSPSIALWNGHAWERINNGPSPSSGANVQALAIAEGSLRPALLLGGDFQQIGGARARCIAAWEGANFSPVDGGMTGGAPTVSTFLTSRAGAVLAAGRFTKAGATTVGSLAALRFVPRWRPTIIPSPRIDPVMTYDSARRVTVLFGGSASIGLSGSPPPQAELGDTWEHDGKRWRRVATGGPDARFEAAGAYDADRGVTVLFGGRRWLDADLADQRFNDTWEWDGSQWRLASLGGYSGPTNPEPRYQHAMAYDRVRGETVMIGGNQVAGFAWAWNGANWLLRNPGVPAREAHDLAFDESRGLLVLFGGSNGARETWESDGNSWTRRSAGDPNGGPAPEARNEHRMAFHAGLGRVVLVGGLQTQSPIGERGDTWAWNGVFWEKLWDVGPSPVQSFGMVYDEQRGGLFTLGGTTQGTQPLMFPPRQEEWVSHDSGWTSDATVVPKRTGHSVAYDSVRHEVLLSGGRPPSGAPFVDLWGLRDGDWGQRAASGPPPRTDGVMAFDRARGRLVVFGGSVSGDPNLTWEWNGEAWAGISSATRPPPLVGMAMAYDEARRECVLFGVSGVGTWTWNGVTWAQVAGSGPPARAFAAMADDPVRQRVVLTGGATSDRGTWEWDGLSWTLVDNAAPSFGTSRPAMVFDRSRNAMWLFGTSSDATAVFKRQGNGWTLAATGGPPRRDAYRAAFDEERGVVVLTQESASGVYLSDTWEWDGIGWTEATTQTPLSRYDAAMAYDEKHKALVLFGGRRLEPMGTGSPTTVYLNDTWVIDADGMRRHPGAGPTRRAKAAMAFDRKRGVTVLYGGVDQSNQNMRDTWEWDGQSWRQAQAVGPSAQNNGQAAYHDRLGGVVLPDARPLLWNGASWQPLDGRFYPAGSADSRVVYDVARERLVYYSSTTRETHEWDGRDWTRRATLGPWITTGFAMFYDAQRRVTATEPTRPVWGDFWEFALEQSGRVAVP